MNILAPIPKICPSLLNSIAGAVIEFENPVIGTIVPAPACFAILPYQFIAVKNALSAIKVIETHVEAVFLSKLKLVMYSWFNACPSVQISPPEIKAINKSFHIGLAGDALHVIFIYFPLVNLAI